MRDPIKIIHKFKNNNRRIQYKVYIFIGSLVPKEILKILESFVDKDLYTTLNTLSKNEHTELEKLYGEYWYEKFFISYHINSQRNMIDSTGAKKKTIEKRNVNKEKLYVRLEELRSKITELEIEEDKTDIKQEIKQEIQKVSSQIITIKKHPI